MRDRTASNRRALYLACATALFISVLPMSRSAAQGGDPSSGSPVIEEIVVHSQKRGVGESQQDVPSAISAYGPTTIEATFSADLTDIGQLAPNVHLVPVSTFPSFANFTIRGIGVSTSLRTVDPAVNVVVDGMVIGFQGGTILDTFDLESLEVLRGPQGILFGRNTTGGAVSLRTSRPNGEERIKGRFTAGSHDRIDAALSVEGTIIEDTLFGKLAFISRNSDGHYDDNNGGTFNVAPSNPSGLQPDNPTQTQSDVDMTIIKPTLVYKPNDDLEFTFLGQYLTSKGGGAATRGFGGAAESGFGYIPPRDPFEINHDLKGSNETKQWHLIGEMNWNLDHGIVTSIIGYRDIEFDTDIDVDGTPFTLVHFPENEESADQISVELRYASTFSERFDFVAGLYYFDQTTSVVERRIIAETLYFLGDFTQDATNYSAFLHANFHLNDLTFSAGGRYTREDKDIDIVLLGLCNGQSFLDCPTGKVHDSDDWTNFSPTIGMHYQMSENAMIYAKWTRGFRSGSYNGRATNLTILGPVDEEKVDSYEVGFKSTFWDGRARLNVAGFHSTFDDIQRITNGFDPVTGAPFQVNQNAAEADINGVEIEFNLHPVDSLTFEANLGWTDASYDEFRNLEMDGDGIITAADAALAKDLDFNHVPEYTAYLAATYDFRIGNKLPGEFSYRISYSWRDDYFTNVLNTPRFAQDDYGLWDMSLTYSADQWRLALFARNLDEEEYFDIRSAALNDQEFGGTARTWGIEFSFEF